MKLTDCVLERCSECYWDEDSETYFCRVYGREVTNHFECGEVED